MNADVYRGLWGGSNCRDSIAQVMNMNIKVVVDFASFSFFLTVLTRGAFYSILDQQNLQLC
jgi:predicted nucleic acid-binding protein